ncbi:hypothetical protein K525DRAFT_291852 [Schizophyllum commune Loenen D]|nr:hypothetical protein K525DRAFT_291852 [Schizophyllum commune Loenen D]
MPSANNPCHVHRKLIDNGEYLPGEAARLGVKRPALDDCFLPPRDPSSLKSISRKRGRIDFLPALASISFFDFPCVKTSCHRDDEDRRALVYRIAPRLRPLWELDSVDKFEDCYIDIVETHFRAYEQGVLHLDISDETALVHTEPNGKAAGCLVDWDLACCPDYRGDGRTLRRGAGPFVAIDLQYVRSNGKLEPQAHHYHHDLESLFWLLVWALMHFDILNGRRLDCKLPSWGTGTRASSMRIAIL